jgi:dihydropyrimidinase
MCDLLIRNALLVNADQTPYPASVAVSGERVVAILPPDTDADATTIIEANGKALFPGLVDPHTHYRYNRGYQTGDTDYDTETRSALVGGITTAIRMHRELSPYAENLPAEVALLTPQARIDMAFHLAIQTEQQLETFEQAGSEYGIPSFKLYLAYKGEAGKLQGLQGADDGFLYDAMRRIGRAGGVALVHCENSEIADRIANQLKADGRGDLAAWTAARPGWAEAEAIHRAGVIAQNADCPLYVVHVSSKEGIAEIERLRERGIAVYAEVCAHHLSMTVAGAEERLGALAKVNPPLRSQADLDALWDAVLRGVVNTVGTDHVPHTQQKAVGRSFWDVMPGFSGSATMLSVLLTEGHHQRGLPLERVAALASRNAARIFRLPGKGAIAVGALADLTLVDVDAERVVDPAALQSVADFGLYQGQPLKGWATDVILRGRIALADGVVKAEPGWGQYVRR